MRAVVQRVSQASVRVGECTVAQIGRGFLILLGVHRQDTEEDAAYLARKISQLRIMADAQDKMNLSLNQVGGEVLVVSQFTLYADTRRGNRPSFVQAAPPAKAQKLYELFCQHLQAAGLAVQTGRFGAMMKVSLVNDGPVTLIIDSQNR